MRAVLEIELFGEDTRAMVKAYTQLLDSCMPGLGNDTIGSFPPSGWVSEITGFDSKYKYARRFLKPKKDYSRSNSKGSRGVFAEYVLESGKIYDVKSQTTWKHVERYFCTVDKNGEIIKLSETEMIECLKSHLE